MTEFESYSNKRFNLNKRITALLPFIAGSLIFFGIHSYSTGNLLEAVVMCIAGICSLCSTLIYLIPTLQKAAYCKVDDLQIVIKEGLFRSTNNYSWDDISSLKKEKTYFILNLKNNQQIDLRPSMLSSSELNQFFQCIETIAAKNELSIH
ncbi:hypothetical protein EYV94_24200 [Puteibacter caeruleilacunae]|nr:hypothetical protein EYV94_24200 [Puteibacter caeruleilacunae]